MTTTDKFREAVTHHFRRSRKLFWTFMAVGLLLFAGGWQVVSLASPEGPVRAYAFIGLILGLVTVAVAAISVGGCCNEGWLGLDPQLRCPHCDREMQIHGGLVLETGICPTCWCRVFADWVKPTLMEKSEDELGLIAPRHFQRVDELAAILLFGIVPIGLAMMMVFSGSVPNRTIGSILLGFTLYGFTGMLTRMRRCFVPVTCPACGRKALLHAARQMPGLRTYHDFYWCLGCHERLKRLENGPWQKAGSQYDDRFYWLWSSRWCLDL